MFFQLSLPSTPPASDTAGDSVLPELGAAGTLTVAAPQRPERGQLVRLTRSRLTKDSLRCRVVAAQEAAVTFTADLSPAPLDDGTGRTQ